MAQTSDPITRHKNQLVMCARAPNLDLLDDHKNDPVARCLEIADEHMRASQVLALEAEMWRDLAQAFDASVCITGTEFFRTFFEKVIDSTPLTGEQRRLLRIACVQELSAYVQS